MERVAGRQVGRDLWLEAVDVAAVAEQVSIQRVTAVSLFIIQLEATVLTEGWTHTPLNTETTDSTLMLT